MNKLYQKSDIWFSVVWIAVYVAASSAADALSEAVGVPKAFTLPLHLALCAAAFAFVYRRHLSDVYGLCKARVSCARYGWFLPLVVVSTTNLWFGVTLAVPWYEAVLTVGSMVCVGALEELIFRGFLYQAMRKHNIKVAVLVSSLTFGIGHMINLFNGSGMGLVANLCQVVGAIAFGFLFVVMVERGGSLWPCIASHSLINALSVFVDEQALSDEQRLIHSGILTVTVVVYTLVLLKTLPRRG